MAENTKTQAKWTPGPWTLELVEGWPFGVSVWSASGDLILHQGAAAHSTGQKTRHDCESGVGFKWKPREGGSSREQAIAVVVEQDANARLIAAAPDLYAALEQISTALRDDGQIDIVTARSVLAKARGTA